MNRLFILGNGFDLAHGLETSYDDFIKEYIPKLFNDAITKLKTSTNFKCDFFEIKLGPEQRREFLYENQSFVYYYRIITETPSIAYENRLLESISTYYYKRFVSKDNITEKRWFDIEQEYYNILKVLSEKRYLRKVEQLNEFLSSLKDNLKEHICNISNGKKGRALNGYKEMIKWLDPFQNENNLVKFSYKTLVLNFNYTKTFENLYGSYLNGIDKIIPIHGTFDTDIVFGYGDEMSQQYKLIEDLNHNEYLRFFKSFAYFKNENYSQLKSFLETEIFEVFILGNSCGLSDRLLLNFIFEHKYCTKIRVLYYDNNQGNNNYENLTMDISRHFVDKQKMRDRILHYDINWKMFQYNDI